MPRYSDNNPHEFFFFNHCRVSSFRFSLFLSLLFCLLTTGTANASEAEEKEPQAVSTQRINAIEANKESDWLVHGYSNREQRHSPLSQVNTKTVAQLGLSWFFDTFPVGGGTGGGRGTRWLDQ